MSANISLGTETRPNDRKTIRTERAGDDPRTGDYGRADDVHDHVVYHLRPARRARRCGDGPRRGYGGDVPRERRRDSAHGVPRELPDSDGPGHGAQLLFHVHSRPHARLYVAGGPRGRVRRRADIHTAFDRRSPGDAHERPSRVPKERHPRRNRPSHNPRRPRMVGHRRRAPGNLRHTREAEIDADVGVDTRPRRNGRAPRAQNKRRGSNRHTRDGGGRAP